jgi:hypothetical protein
MTRGTSGQARQTTEAETITQPATAKARAPASSSHDRGAPAKSGPREAAKRGRPRIEDRDKTLNATKPWAALGMSRRTWYRRRGEKLKAK